MSQAWAPRRSHPVRAGFRPSLSPLPCSKPSLRGAASTWKITLPSSPLSLPSAIPQEVLAGQQDQLQHSPWLQENINPLQAKGRRSCLGGGGMEGSGQAGCFSPSCWGKLTLDGQMGNRPCLRGTFSAESAQRLCPPWFSAGHSSKCLWPMEGGQMGLLHSLPPFPLFLPRRNSPSDLAFNGDLAAPASSEPPTDVSYPPILSQNHGILELEGSSEIICATSLFRWGNRGEEEVTCPRAGPRTQISQLPGHGG